MDHQLLHGHLRPLRLPSGAAHLRGGDGAGVRLEQDGLGEAPLICGRALQGTVMSCFFWGYTITQILAGTIADKHGGEKILSATTLSWSVLTLFTPQLFDFAYWTNSPLLFLLLVRVATGVGQGEPVRPVRSVQFRLPPAQHGQHRVAAPDRGR